MQRIVHSRTRKATEAKLSARKHPSRKPAVRKRPMPAPHPTANGGDQPIDTALAKRRDMSWHDYLIGLLHLGSALEHSLMVQYLYAAYSLGGEQVPLRYRPMVQHWQQLILAVAREEMGHLLTVQNVLTFLGAGLSLTRENLPWEIQWFNLEPLTLGSLACYVFAEMPANAKFPEKALIQRMARHHVKKHGRKLELQMRPVGEVYTDIMAVLANSELIPDSAFQDASYVLQASWDDWGRGYKPDPLPLDPEGNLQAASARARVAEQQRAHIMIDRVASRTQALAALEALSIQGEGPLGDGDLSGAAGTSNDGAAGGGGVREPSHFARFLHIFRQFYAIKDEKWSPTLDLPINPNTVSDPLAPNRGGYISSAQSRNWADLFNLRYRMLLTFLMHTFQVARDTRPGEPNVRAMLMHKVFGEMYHLKTIAGILVGLPQHGSVTPGVALLGVRRAAPPFELPFNIRLPAGDADCWCLHLDILGSVAKVYQAILATDARPHDHVYIGALMDLDRQTTAWIERILAGLNSTERYSI